MRVFITRATGALGRNLVPMLVAAGHQVTAYTPERTQDGGETWEDLREGLPQENAWDVVLRHSLHNSGDALAFGSTTRNLYVSDNRGEAWRTMRTTCRRSTACGSAEPEPPLHRERSWCSR